MKLNVKLVAALFTKKKKKNQKKAELILLKLGLTFIHKRNWHWVFLQRFCFNLFQDLVLMRNENNFCVIASQFTNPKKGYFALNFEINVLKSF